MFYPLRFVKLCFPHQQSAYISPHQLAQVGGGNLVPPTIVFKPCLLVTATYKSHEGISECLKVLQNDTLNKDERDILFQIKDF